MNQPIVKDDSHSDYQGFQEQARALMAEGVWTNRFADERFVRFDSREMRSDMPREAIDLISKGKHYFSYRGIPLAKDPFDKALYEVLFYEVKPRTVIEFGAFAGGSAVWMADLLKTFELEGHVYSFDIDLGLVVPAALEHPGVTFRQGDCNQIAAMLPAEMLAELPHPWIVVDDAHVNMVEVCEHLHGHGMQPGDYLVMEDTIPCIPASFNEGEMPDVDWGDWKWNDLLPFLEKHASEYLVDRYYTDFFGYNGTWNWNGFFKRV